MRACSPNCTAYAHRLGQVEGSIVATTDGLVIAHDLGASETYGVEPDGVAALAAVSLGLSQRIADTASHGDLRETVDPRARSGRSSPTPPASGRC